MVNFKTDNKTLTSYFGNNFNQNSFDENISFKYFFISILLVLAIIAKINLANNQNFVRQNQILQVNLLAIESAKSIISKSLAKQKKQQNKQFIHNENAKLNYSQKQVKTNESDEKIITKKTAKKPENQNLSKANSNNESAKIIHQPNYKLQMPPNYPRKAVELGWQGFVKLHVKISKDGLVENLEIAKSSGYKILDNSAILAVKKWQFHPTIINENAVESVVEVPVNFVINQS